MSTLRRAAASAQSMCFFCGKVAVSHPMDCCKACGERQRNSRGGAR